MSDAKPPILAIAAPVRGEAPYLLEWIAYHRVLGIKAFLLGDNAGDDEATSKLLQALHDHKIIFRFDWRGQTRFQLEFYKQALAAARLFADGIFLIDVDEFLRLTASFSVLQIAQKWLADPSIGAVALNWAIYGSSSREEAGEGLVIERFTGGHRKTSTSTATPRPSPAFPLAPVREATRTLSHWIRGATPTRSVGILFGIPRVPIRRASPRT
jgi:hypothetical protein